jgi:cytochrome c-type biogenesis protein CcmH
MGDDRLAALSSPPPGHPLDLAAAGELGSTDAGASSQAGLPSVDEMTVRLAARLSQHPDDIEGWRTLGWSYLNLGRFSEAAATYASAIKLDPGNMELRGGRVEALVDSANGTVTTEAKTAIAEALKLDTRNARMRFFEGLAKQQDGDKAAALTEWTDLLRDADPEEGWVADLKTRLSQLRRDMGIEAGTLSARPKPAIARLSPKESAEQPTPSTADKGPTADDMRAAGAMNPAERSEMIRGMVDGLAGRLERSPRDADGWIKLIRARTVLGDSDLAKQALARGLEVFADDTAERERIAASARQLGLAP